MLQQKLQRKHVSAIVLNETLIDKHIKILYRAVDKDGIPFLHHYGIHKNEVFIADNYLDVAYNAALNDKCRVHLQCKEDDCSEWHDADDFEQKMFQRRLEADYAFNEMK